MPLNLEAAAVADVDAHVAEVKAVFPAGLNRIARAGAAAGGTPEGPTVSWPETGASRFSGV